jgi:hypothetical protein
LAKKLNTVLTPCEEPCLVPLYLPYPVWFQSAAARKKVEEGGG